MVAPATVVIRLHRVGRRVGADFSQGAKPGREAFEKLLGERGVRWITYADWQKIDQAEIANAPAGAPRRKFLTVEDMLAVL